MGISDEDMMGGSNSSENSDMSGTDMGGDSNSSNSDMGSSDTNSNSSENSDMGSSDTNSNSMGGMPDTGGMMGGSSSDENTYQDSKIVSVVLTGL